MNRYEQFQVDKRREEKAALVASGQSLDEADARLAARDRREQAAAWLHATLFDEEYDELTATTADLMDRRRGMNPMSTEYQSRIAAKREALGVPPLDRTGVSRGTESLEMCRRLVHGVAARM